MSEPTIERVLQWQNNINGPNWVDSASFRPDDRKFAELLFPESKYRIIERTTTVTERVIE